VEIKVGVENTPREVALESEQTPEQVTAAVEAALANGSLLSLTDDRGRTVIAPRGLRLLVASHCLARQRDPVLTYAECDSR
jgi:hypothetical protein